MLERATYQLRLPETGRVRLILDASDSASAVRGRVLDLAIAACAGLPAFPGPAVQLLGGDDSPLPAALLASDGDWWLEDHEACCSLLEPCLRRDAQAYEATLIVGAGPIYDLEDWLDDPRLGRLVLASFGAPLAGDAPLPPAVVELTSPTSREVLRGLHDPPVEFWVEGDGFLPLDWEPRQWFCEPTPDGFRLSVCPEDHSGWAFEFRCATAAGTSPRAYLKAASGLVSELPLAPAPRCCLADGELTPCSPALAEALRRALAGSDYTCPLCRQTHSATNLRCFATDRLVGEPILAMPSTAPLLALFEVSESGARDRPCYSGVAVTGEREALVLDGRRISRWQFDSDSCRWTRIRDEPEGFVDIGGGRYAVVI